MSFIVLNLGFQTPQPGEFIGSRGDFGNDFSTDPVNFQPLSLKRVLVSRGLILVFLQRCHLSRSLKVLVAMTIFVMAFTQLFMSLKNLNFGHDILY